jgi:hypothetical protein
VLKLFLNFSKITSAINNKKNKNSYNINKMPIPDTA